MTSKVETINGIEHITVYDGKYTLILEPTNMRALRNGEPWRDLIGDGFVMALGQAIAELHEALRNISEGAEQYLRDVGTIEDPCWVPCAKGDPGAILFREVS